MLVCLVPAAPWRFKGTPQERFPSNLQIMFWPSAPTNRQDPNTWAVASPATTFNTIQLPSPAPDNQNCPELGNKTFSTKNGQQPSTIAQNSPKSDHFKDARQALWCTSITAANITSHTKHSWIFWGWEVDSWWSQLQITNFHQSFESPLEPTPTNHKGNYNGKDW